MSHGTHAVQHEVEHHIAHGEHGHGGDHAEKTSGSQNRKIALLISVIALFLALSETLGKSAQTAGIADNVEASNLWAFFQAKTIRRTLVETASQEMAVTMNNTADDALKTAMAKQIDTWKAEAARYRSEPSTREGSSELAARAVAAQKNRDTSMAKYHHYEVASAAFQIAIVMASASVITSMLVLAYVAGGLGIIGLVFTAIGLFAPHAVHLL
jgi:hypothetical protein